MKKALLVLFALSFVIATAAMATETRVTTMGENNETLKDEHNIWLYPSTINMYPNMVGGLVSGGEFSVAGGHWQLGNSVLGLYFDANGYPLYFAEGEYNRTMDNRINLFYGRQLADMPFGLRLSMWGDGSRNEDMPVDSENYDNKYSRFEAAVGVTAMEGKMDVAAAIGMSSFTEERNVENPFDDGVFVAYDDLASDSSFDFDMRARYWHQFDEKWTLIPHVSFSSSSMTVIARDGDIGDVEDEEWALYDAYKYEESGTFFNLGVGTNYQASEKVMTVTDLGIWFSSSTVDGTENPSPFDAVGTAAVTNTQEYKPSAVPYIKAGLEGTVKSWLDVRVGMVSEWRSAESTESQTNWTSPARSYSNTSYGVSTSTYLGTGFNFGDLHIDTELNARFLTDGPYFITGRPNNGYYEDYAGDWAAQVAFRYDFD